MRNIKLFFILFFLTSCASVPEQEPLNKKIILTKTNYQSLPNWKNDNTILALEGFKKSCEAFLKMDKNKILYHNYSENQDIKAKEMQEICQLVPDKNVLNNKLAKRFFEIHFAPYLVSYEDGGVYKSEGKFTGYYEASLKGSLHKTPLYNVPIYAKPEELINGKKYYTRRQIENGAIADKADVLLWLDDEVEAHYLHIQGSAVVALPNGEKIRIGYAGNNGHEFKGIGSILMSEGIRPMGGYSTDAVKSWLKSYRKKGRRLMQKNKRYIFFRIVDRLGKLDGPIGGFGISLTPTRSLAVDKTFIPLGFPIYLNTKDPFGRKMQLLSNAQDVGAAIKGPVRGDIFWGSGENALKFAGAMNNPGNYFLLLPRKRKNY